MKSLYVSRLLTWILMITLTLWLDSCKKDDTTTTPDTTASIDGNYKLNTLTIDPAKLGTFTDLVAASKVLLNNTTCLTDFTVAFKTTGDASVDNPTSCQTAGIPVSTFTGIDATSKWVVNGKTLTITQSNGTKTDYTIVSNTGGILKLQWKGLLNYPTADSTVYTFTMELKKQ